MKKVLKLIWPGIGGAAVASCVSLIIGRPLDALYGFLLAVFLLWVIAVAAIKLKEKGYL